MAEIVATFDEKLTPDFEAMISEVDKAIQSEPCISSPNSIRVDQLKRVEQLKNKTNFYSGLVDIEVMDDDSLTCKRGSSGKSFEPCIASCLLENDRGVNAEKGYVKEDSNPVTGRPKRSGHKNMGGLLSIQGPKTTGLSEGATKKAISTDCTSSSARENGLKNRTWKRAVIKPRASIEVPINKVLGPKRNSKEMLRGTEKTDLIEKAILTKKKSKVSITEELQAIRVGIIARDWNGRFVAAMCRKIQAPLGPLEAESKAVEVGLQFAWQLGISDLTIEGDALIIFRTLNQNSSSVSASIDAVITGIRLAVLEFHNVFFSHVKRSVNTPAHLLAKYAKGIVHQCMWMENCPSFIELAILHDVNSIVI
nr:hypothetical protein CFP56_76757 [Quercus suber]